MTLSFVRQNNPISSGDFNTRYEAAGLTSDYSFSKGGDTVSIDGLFMDWEIIIINSIVEDIYDDSFNDKGVLANKKRKFKNKVDRKSRQLIAQGFNYDGQTMSLSDKAQANATNLNNDRASLSYPLNLINRDDTGAVALADEAGVNAYYEAGKARKMSVLIAGASLKMQAEAAVNETELSAITDNRT